MYELIHIHIYYSLTFACVNNPLLVQSSLAIYYFSCSSIPQPSTFCWTGCGGSERKANERGHPCLWLFHRRRRRRKITLSLVLNDAMKSQSRQRPAVCTGSVSLFRGRTGRNVHSNDPGSYGSMPQWDVSCGMMMMSTCRQSSVFAEASSLKCHR